VAVEIIPVFANLSSGYFLEGKQSRQTTNQPFGQFFSRNNLYLQVFPVVVNTAATLSTPLAACDVSGMSLVASIYSSDGATVLATGSSFTADTSAGTLTGNVDCNTVAMASYVSTATTASVIIEFRFTGAYGSRNVRTTGTIQNQRNYSGSPTAIPDTTYVTTPEMNARALLRDNGAGVGYILTSPDGTKRGYVYLSNNGTLECDLL